MAPTINNRLGFEVLQPSSLHDFPWPETDPSETVQAIVPWNERYSALLDAAVANTEFFADRFHESNKGLPVAQQLWNLLTHRAFNFNGVTALRKESYWIDRISESVQNSAPIYIPYPLVCKIGNPAKRMTTVGITAGERTIVRFFKNIAQFARKIYSPGIRICILSDATLYNSALQVPPPSAYAYISDMRQLVKEEKASDSIEIHDYTELLSPFYREFEAAYNRVYKLLGVSMEEMLDKNSMTSLPTSMRASLNSRRFGMAYAELLDLFGPRQIRFQAVRRELDDQAFFALREQLAIKLACDEINLPQRIWPAHVRATCHRGMKNGRAVLGLRCYPEYYSRSRLLPYHGMPFLEENSQGRPVLVILPEVILRARKTLTRVVNDCGEPVLYCA